MSGRMRISVIIPCRGAGPYVEQAIGSVLAQSRPPEEIIFIDDGSTDESLARARAFGGAVRIHSEVFGDGPSARNRGVSLATGDALFFLDADDVLGPNALKALAAALERRPDAIATCPWYRLEPVRGFWIRRAPSCRARLPGEDPLSAWLGGWYQPTSSILWSRAAYEATGGWDNRFPVNGDGYIMMRALALGRTLVMATNGSSYYRRLPPGRQASSDRRFSAAGVDGRIRLVETIASLLAERNALDSYRSAMWEAFRLIAADAKPFPALRERCFASANRLGGRRRARAWIRSRTRAAIKTASAFSDRPRMGRPVTFGLGVAGHSSEMAPRAPIPFTNAEPVVSVVVPTHNRAAHIGRALRGVFAQTYSDFEVIVVDDGSTDGTRDGLGAYADPRLRTVFLEGNRGPGAARNAGIARARGRYIALLDSDDEWFPGKLAAQIERFSRCSDAVGVIYTGCETMDEDGGIWTFTPSARGNIRRRLLRENLLHGGPSTCLLRRVVVDAVGPFDTSLPAIEDYEFWIRAAGAFEFDFIPDTLARLHDAPEPNRRSRDGRANLAARAALFERYAKELRAVESDHLFLVKSARMHLSRYDFHDARNARSLALKALRARPFRLAPYIALLTTLVPAGPYRAARRIHDAVRFGRRPFAPMAR